jgi:hypothetical protein
MLFKITVYQKLKTDIVIPEADIVIPEVDIVIPEVSSCKYLGIILCSDLSWADQVNYTVKKAWKALHFTMHILKNGNGNTKV